MQYNVEISTASLPLTPSLMYRMQGTYKMECALASADVFHTIPVGITEIWGTFA